MIHWNCRPRVRDPPKGKNCFSDRKRWEDKKDRKFKFHFNVSNDFAIFTIVKELWQVDPSHRRSCKRKFRKGLLTFFEGSVTFIRIGQEIILDKHYINILLRPLLLSFSLLLLLLLSSSLPLSLFLSLSFSLSLSPTNKEHSLQS